MALPWVWAWRVATRPARYSVGSHLTYSRAARADLARFTIWRNQTWDHGRQRPWPNGLAMDERAQAGEEAEMVPNATVDAVSSEI
jgi:hypothetical protein